MDFIKRWAFGASKAVESDKQPQRIEPNSPIGAASLDRQSIRGSQRPTTYEGPTLPSREAIRKAGRIIVPMKRPFCAEEQEKQDIGVQTKRSRLDKEGDGHEPNSVTHISQISRRTSITPLPKRRRQSSPEIDTSANKKAKVTAEEDDGSKSIASEQDPFRSSVAADDLACSGSLPSHEQVPDDPKPTPASRQSSATPSASDDLETWTTETPGLIKDNHPSPTALPKRKATPSLALRRQATTYLKAKSTSRDPASPAPTTDGGDAIKYAAWRAQTIAKHRHPSPQASEADKIDLPASKPKQLTKNEAVMIDGSRFRTDIGQLASSSIVIAPLFQPLTEKKEKFTAPRGRLLMSWKMRDDGRKQMKLEGLWDRTVGLPMGPKKWTA